LAQGDSGTLQTWTVFTRSPEDVLYLILAHRMGIDMRLSCLRIKNKRTFMRYTDQIPTSMNG
jgi:hypothetical protein